MMYPFMTLDDGTEIVYSEKKNDGSVKVYMEKTDEKDGFHYATCYLPEYRWEDIFGLTEQELSRCRETIETSSQLIIQFAQESRSGHTERT